jgi:hypothetical protein
MDLIECLSLCYPWRRTSPLIVNEHFFGTDQQRKKFHATEACADRFTDSSYRGSRVINRNSPGCLRFAEASFQARSAREFDLPASRSGYNVRFNLCLSPHCPPQKTSGPARSYAGNAP